MKYIALIFVMLSVTFGIIELIVYCSKRRAAKDKKELNERLDKEFYGI